MDGFQSYFPFVRRSFLQIILLLGGIIWLPFLIVKITDNQTIMRNHDSVGAAMSPKRSVKGTVLAKNRQEIKKFLQLLAQKVFVAHQELKDLKVTKSKTERLRC